MKLTPVKRYKKPGYPTREAMVSSSSPLGECVPTRWKGNTMLTTMLAVYLLGPEKGDAQTGSPAGSTLVTVRGDQGSGRTIPEHRTERLSELPSIAPIFLHGDGRGVTGCVVINPPVFLSEEEARQIIEEELMKENIIFDKKNVELNGVAIQQKYERDSEYRSGEEVTVNLDGYSSKYNLGYEVVTGEDYYKFGGEYSLSTVHNYDLVKAAENLRNKLRERGKMNVAIFYDPLERDEDRDPKNQKLEEMLREQEFYKTDKGVRSQLTHADGKKQSIELLKRQVSDFIQWIKKEKLFGKQ
jgi:hypothetical protein